MHDNIWSGFIIGAAGGGVAGLILWIVGRLNDYEIKWREERRVYKWLDTVTTSADAKKWRATRAIASYTNLPEDRIRYLCSHHTKIVLSTKEKEMWGIAGRARDEDETGIV
jgi:hypothetical protein